MEDFTHPSVEARFKKWGCYKTTPPPPPKEVQALVTCKGQEKIKEKGGLKGLLDLDWATLAGLSVGPRTR
jgi:hypothetical protein